eukprot:1187572-Prorocentrum_minimum.AAC.2
MALNNTFKPADMLLVYPYLLRAHKANADSAALMDYRNALQAKLLRKLWVHTPVQTRATLENRYFTSKRVRGCTCSTRSRKWRSSCYRYDCALWLSPLHYLRCSSIMPESAVPLSRARREHA